MSVQILFKPIEETKLSEVRVFRQADLKSSSDFHLFRKYIAGNRRADPWAISQPTSTVQDFPPEREPVNCPELYIRSARCASESKNYFVQGISYFIYGKFI